MATRDAQPIDTGSRIRSKRGDKFYVVVLLMWMIAASLLLYELFDIRSASAQSACGDRTISSRNLRRSIRRGRRRWDCRRMGS